MKGTILSSELLRIEKQQISYNRFLNTGRGYDVGLIQLNLQNQFTISQNVYLSLYYCSDELDYVFWGTRVGSGSTSYTTFGDWEATSWVLFNDEIPSYELYQSPPCNDGDGCSLTDICQHGSCIGTNPLVCTPSDSFHLAGVCQSPSGICTNPEKSSHCIQDLFNDAANPNDVGDVSFVKFHGPWTLTSGNPSLTSRTATGGTQCINGCLYFSNSGKSSSFNNPKTASVVVDFVQTTISIKINMTVFVGTNILSGGQLNILLDNNIIWSLSPFSRGVGIIPSNGGPFPIIIGPIDGNFQAGTSKTLTIQTIATPTTTNSGDRVDAFISDFKVSVC